MISEILKSQLVNKIYLTQFQEKFLNDIEFIKENERINQSNYKDFLSSDDKDLKSYLNKIMECSDFLYQKYKIYKDEIYNDDKEEKLNREEENGKQYNLFLEIEQVYLQQNVESGQNSDYGAEDDLEGDIQNKESLNKNDFQRPYSSSELKKQVNRIAIKAKNKK